jgi:hypothetical protein
MGVDLRLPIAATDLSAFGTTLTMRVQFAAKPPSDGCMALYLRRKTTDPAANNVWAEQGGSLGCRKYDVAVGQWYSLQWDFSGIQQLTEVTELGIQFRTNPGTEPGLVYIDRVAVTDDVVGPWTFDSNAADFVLEARTTHTTLGWVE